MISVIVSSIGRQKVLEQCLSSLRRQTLAPTDIIVLETHLKMSRLEGVQKAQGSILLFLDEDCELPDENYLSRLVMTTEQLGASFVLGGLYQNAEKASYSARSYNSICNLWAANNGNLLGGCLILPKEILAQRTWNDSIGWGGEDTYLLRQLQKAGVSLVLDRQLDVIHNDQSSLRKWTRRAFRQGYHRQKYQLASPNMRFSSELLSQTLSHFPFYCLHFSCVLLGMAFWNIKGRFSG